MRFTVDRAPLLEAVTRVQGAAGGGKTVPILAMVLIRAEGDGVTVRATDLTVQATAGAPATVQQAGAVCVPVQQLHDLLRSLPEGGEVGFTVEGKDARISVVCGRSRFKLPTLPAGDFPTWRDDGAGEVSGSISAEVLARLIDKSLFAASNEETRYFLRGVFLHVPGRDGAANALCAVATDGVMLAFAEADCPSDLEGIPPVIIPTRLLSEMRRWLGAMQGEVGLAVSPSCVRLELGDRQLLGQTIDGKFPDYPRVIPAPQTRPARTDIGLLRSAVRRVMLAAEADGKTKMRVIRAAFAPGRLGLSSHSAERGEAQEDLEAVYDGQEIEIAFNALKLTAIAERIGGAAADIHLTAPLDPVLITDPGDPRAQFVIMTVRG